MLSNTCIAAGETKWDAAIKRDEGRCDQEALRRPGGVFLSTCQSPAAQPSGPRAFKAAPENIVTCCNAGKSGCDSQWKVTAGWLLPLGCRPVCLLLIPRSKDDCTEIRFISCFCGHRMKTSPEQVSTVCRGALASVVTEQRRHTTQEEAAGGGAGERVARRDSGGDGRLAQSAVLTLPHTQMMVFTQT